MFWTALLVTGLGAICAKLGAMSVWLQVLKATTIFLLSALMLAGAILLRRAIRKQRPREAAAAARLLHREQEATQ